MRHVYSLTLTAMAANLRDFFADLVRCETRLYNALNDRLRERHGIVMSQYEFLSYVRDHPDARVADVAAEFAIGIGATSKGIDRLEGQGWIVRRPNPGDRRSSLLAVTDEGRRLADAAGEVVADRLADLVGASAVVAAAPAMAELRAALERDRIGMPVG